MAARMSRRRGTDGAAAVEFALVSVPVIVLLFGLIQYGLYFWAMQGGSDIARDAARLASVGNPSSCSAFRSAVQDRINGLTGTGSTATIQRTYTEQTAGKVSVGDSVHVVVQFKSADMHFPFLPFIRDGVITSQSDSRVEYVPSQPESCS